MPQARLPWWESSDSVGWFHTTIGHARELLNHQQPLMATYAKRCLAGSVFMANKVEGTLPAGFTDRTAYQLLDDVCSQPFSMPAACPEPICVWPAEGGAQQSPSSTYEGSKQQLVQFTKAAQHLVFQLGKPLTAAVVCTAHRIMMWGAVEEDGTLMAAGTYRSSPAHSGTGYVYPAPALVPQLLQDVISTYNSKQQAGEDSCSLAAYLLYHTVVVHPFMNGNGRLSSLLAGYAAMAAGEPFMLILSNGHTRNRKMYQQVLRHADNHQQLSRLESYILECLNRQWQNAVAYAGLSQKAAAETGHCC